MIRLKECCFGIRLRTGTLILLWLNLMLQASFIFHLAVVVVALLPQVRFTHLHLLMLTWRIILLVTNIYALIGVDKQRPSYMRPFIGTYMTGIIAAVLFVAVMWIRFDKGTDAMYNIQRTYFLSSSSKEAARAAYHDFVIMVTIISAIYLVFDYYFLSVVYSYYRQMQDEDKGIYCQRHGVVIAPLAVQPQPVYGHQPAFYSQQNTGPLPSSSYPMQNIQCPRQFPVSPQ